MSLAQPGHTHTSSLAPAATTSSALRSHSASARSKKPALLSDEPQQLSTMVSLPSVIWSIVWKISRVSSGP